MVLDDTHTGTKIYTPMGYLSGTCTILQCPFSAPSAPLPLCLISPITVGETLPAPCPSLSHSSHSSHSPLSPISGNQGLTTHLVTMATGLWCDHGLMFLLPSPYSDIIPLITPARMVTSYMYAFGKCIVEHNDLY